MNRHLLLLLPLLPWFFMAFHPGFSESESSSLQPSFSSQSDRHMPFQIFLQEDHGKVYISWFAPEAAEVTHYLVERKEPQGNFFVIGGLNAAISDDRYEFEDLMERHSKGPFLYRVKIFFSDKTFVYSEIKEFAPAILSSLNITSGGEKGMITFTIDEHVAHGVLSILSLNGTVIHQESWNGSTGQISMKRFPDGIYILEVKSGNKSWQAQVVTQ